MINLVLNIILAVILLIEGFILLGEKYFLKKNHSKLKRVLYVLGLVILIADLGIYAANSIYQPPFYKWKTYKSSYGNFSIKMPNEPNIYSEEEDTVNFDFVDRYSYQVVVSPKYYYNITPKEYMDKLTKEDIEGINGKLISQKNITLGNIPGRELVISGEPKIIINTRIFITKDRVYEVWNEVPQTASMLDAVFPPMTNEYLNSFKFE